MTTLRLWKIAVLESRKIDEDIVYQHQDAVRQRLSEIHQLILPMSEDEWDHVLRHLGTLLVPVNATSDLCRNHSIHLQQSFLDQEIWALRMVDASSKLQSGLLDGNLHNFGSYSQCISVEEPNKMFQGQHCIIQTTGILPPEISDIVVRKNFGYFGDDGLFSLCVPSSCSDHDVHTHVNLKLEALGAKSVNYLDTLSLSTDIRKISCSTSEGLPFRTKDYFAMFVFSLVIFVVLLATFIGPQSGCLSYFSLSKNFQELMDTRVSQNEIICLSGLRVIFIFLTIIGHRLFGYINLPSPRPMALQKSFGTVLLDTLELTTSRSVDVFFLLGGTVLSYNFLLTTQRKENFNYLSFIFKRYFRVTPVLAAMVLFDATLLIHSSQGPIWLRYISPSENRCNIYWWRSLLHINFLMPIVSCMGEAWYVACDFQLYCISPLVLLLLPRHPRMGLAVASLGFLLSIAALTASAFYLKISSGHYVAIPFLDRMTDMAFPIIYIGTIFRANPFFLGLALGYTIYACGKTKGSNVLSKQTALLGWLLTAATMTGLILINMELVSPDHKYMPLLDPLFFIFSRPLYAACFGWLVFACHFGYGGCINRFLSWAGFRPLGKLVFSVMLTHMHVQYLQLASAESPYNFRYKDLLIFCMGDVVISFIVAAVMYIFVEVPFSKLANHFITDIESRRKTKRK